MEGGARFKRTRNTLCRCKNRGSRLQQMQQCTHFAAVASKRRLCWESVWQVARLEAVRMFNGHMNKRWLSNDRECSKWFRWDPLFHPTRQQECNRYTSKGNLYKPKGWGGEKSAHTVLMGGRRELDAVPSNLEAAFQNGSHSYWPSSLWLPGPCRKWTLADKTCLFKGVEIWWWVRIRNADATSKIGGLEHQHLYIQYWKMLFCLMEPPSPQTPQ